MLTLAVSLTSANLCNCKQHITKTSYTHPLHTSFKEADSIRPPLFFLPVWEGNFPIVREHERSKIATIWLKLLMGR